MPAPFSQNDDLSADVEEMFRTYVTDTKMIESLQVLIAAEIARAALGQGISDGGDHDGYDQRIAQAEQLVQVARRNLDVALCAQQRGEPYRLLDASHGGVARSMRFRLSQNRKVSGIEAHAERQAAQPLPVSKPFGRRPVPDSRLPAVASVGSL